MQGIKKGFDGIKAKKSQEVKYSLRGKRDPQVREKRQNRQAPFNRNASNTKYWNKERNVRRDEVTNATNEVAAKGFTCKTRNQPNKLPV